MKKLLVAITVTILSFNANSQCVGSGNVKTCLDSSGNSYFINKIGNTTYTNGTSSNGSSWSQTSTTFGNTTYHDGTSSDGGNWNSTQIQMGNGFQSWSGTDSNGNSFNCTSSRYGSNC